MAPDILCDVIAASKAFHILVGPEKKSFIMHSELLARQSKPLEKLVKGGMKEAADGIAEWPEVDPETFFRFWQFTYTGDYTGAEPKEVPPTPPPTPPTPPAVEDTETGQSLDLDMANESSEPVSWPVRIRKKKRVARTSWRDSSDMTSGIWGSPNQEQSIQGQLMDHSEEFLSHARIYVLADYYHIPRLAQLSIQKLDKSLNGFIVNFPPNGKQECRATEDVVAVLEYCYSHTVDKGSSRDELRQLLARHVARRVHQMWPHPGFQSALESSGEMARDIIGHLL